jgi:F0F1-type ATP synthase membrane subunit b/b'
MEVFPNWTSIPIILFLIILTYVLNRTFFRPMDRTLNERHRKIEGAKVEAEEIRKASQERVFEFEKRMRDARRAADAQMAEARNQALGEKTKVVSEKRNETEKMLSDARADIRRKTDEARRQLEAEGHNFAAQIASQILNRPVQGKQ